MYLFYVDTLEKQKFLILTKLGKPSEFSANIYFLNLYYKSYKIQF